jgi:hypothetical protein
MIKKTIDSLPIAKKNVVIIRKDHDEKYNFSEKIKRENKNIEVMKLNKKTSGMASTCYEYVKKINKKTPLLISSCDYAVIFDEKKFSIEQKLDDYMKKKIAENLYQLQELQKKDPNLIIFFFPPKEFLLETNLNEFDNFFFKKIYNKKNYYNLTDDLKSLNNKDNIYYDSIHLNSKGHQIMSEVLFKLLKSNFF